MPFRRVQKEINFLIIFTTVLLSLMFYWSFIDEPVLTNMEVKILDTERVYYNHETVNIQYKFNKNNECIVSRVTDYFINVDTGSFRRFDRIINGIITNPINAENVHKGDNIVVNQAFVIPGYWDPGHWIMYRESVFDNCGANPFQKHSEFKFDYIHFLIG